MNLTRRDKLRIGLAVLGAMLVLCVIGACNAWIVAATGGG